MSIQAYILAGSKLVLPQLYGRISSERRSTSVPAKRRAGTQRTYSRYAITLSKLDIPQIDEAHEVEVQDHK